jgi:hypothetical protein
MALFTYYNADTQEVIAKGRPWPTADENTPPPGLDAGVVLLKEIKESKPTYDSATHKLKRLPAIYDVENELAILQSYEVVELTQDEIDAKIPAHYLSTQGIMLDVSLEAQNAFTRMMTLIQQAQMPAEQEVKVQDVYKESHTMTVADFSTEMVLYGLHCYELFHTVPEPVDPDFI